MFTSNTDTIKINVQSAQPLSAYHLHSVAVVIPAFNEAGRVGAVVKAACQVEFVNEVIVVDDGSTDHTAEEALGAACNDVPVQLVQHSANQGKGQAMIHGWKAARGSLVLFLDADLMNLKPDHIRDLALPVLNRQAAMSMGIFEHGRWITDLSHRLTPWLTGQRCVVAELLNDLSPEASAGYGFETALSIEAKRRGWPVHVVHMHGVSHPTQLRRKGWSSVSFKTKMIAHVVRAWLIMRKAAR